MFIKIGSYVVNSEDITSLFLHDDGSILVGARGLIDGNGEPVPSIRIPAYDADRFWSLFVSPEKLYEDNAPPHNVFAFLDIMTVHANTAGLLQRRQEVAA